MVNKVNKVFRWIATILWVLGGLFLAAIALNWWSSDLPKDWSDYAVGIWADVSLLIAPALTISLVLWINASRDAKKAHSIPHEAPLLIHEHHSQK